MSNRALAIALVLTLIVTASALAQLQPVRIMDNESGASRIMWQKNSETLYNMNWKVRRLERDGRQFYVYTGSGDNAKQGAERISWTEESEVEIRPDGSLRTVFWRKVSSGAEQMTWDLKYDWRAGKLTYHWEDRLSGKREDKTIKFGADAWPGDALNFLLRGFPFEKGVGFSVRGSILMTDGSILDGVITLRGEERIKTAFGEIDCYKLQLEPAGALSLVAPDMFMWYTMSEPHLWLRFDGRDEGLTSPRTKNVLLRYEPAGLIK